MDSERICKNCRHWQKRAINMCGIKTTSFGYCNKMSDIWKMLTWEYSLCDTDLNAFEVKEET